MADWNLSFDFAAIFFMLLIFIWHFNEKRVPLRSHQYFLNFLVTAFAATALEIAATYMARSMDVVGYNNFYAVLTLQTFAVNMLPIMFSFYLLQLAHIDVARNKALRVFYTASVAADVILLLLNLKFQWAFTFENARYQIKAVGLLLYVIDIAMLAVCMVALIRSRREIRFLRIVPLIFNLICTISACLIQIFLYIPTLNFMIAAICMTLYYYQQNVATVTDAVTMQFNRKFLGEYLRDVFAQKKEFAIIMVAMDDFKFVNKTYGVETGDSLLLEVGQFLEHLNASQTVFRFGSDQFCVVLSKKVQLLAEVTDQIQQRFHHPWYSLEETPIMMSASICTVQCPQDADTYGELIEVIDYSMTVAKKTQKGCVSNASDIDLDKIKQDKAMEKAIKLAIDRDELMVYYQPIFSVKKNVYNSAEALVRIHDEELGWISPEEFIPIAEKNGLIIEMGERILTKVCRFIRDFHLSETSVEYIEVNISPVQLNQLGFADRVKHILEEYDVNPEQINIEITETATINAGAKVNDNISSLLDYGISFSLDDYGSGNANISYINHMPFKIIKIDKFIIWDSFKNEKAGITLEYTIGMLNALNLYIVAEGIETEEMQQCLEKFGCHYMQGWYYSKAIPEQEFAALVCG